MRRLVSGILAIVMVVGVSLLGPTAISASVPDDTTTETSTETTVPDATMLPATRGTAVQVAPTLPPPTTTTPPTTKPAPPPPSLAVPANSGSGRRAVYSKSQMRVWVIEANGAVVRTYLVSGRYDQPPVGTFSVFSRSSYTCSIKSASTCMRWMVRFTKGPSGDNIGFHEIPKKNGVWLQSESQLGQALSAGCIRQGPDDAWFMWNWAYVGTKVVVVW